LAPDKRIVATLLWLVHTLVLTAWIGALSWLGSGSGDDPLLGRFIRSDYWWLVYAATGVFIALLASMAISKPPQGSLERWRKLIEAVVLCLPLLFLPMAVRSELSTTAAEKRSLFTPRLPVRQTDVYKPGTTGVRTPQETQRGSSNPNRLAAKQPGAVGTARAVNKSKPLPDNSKQSAAAGKSHGPSLLDLVTKPEDFEGSDAELVGMVHKDKRLAADSFYCYRLLMVCCAADASPIGVIVKWPEAGKLPKGTWVKVHGKVGFTPFEGEDYPTISAINVEKTATPKNRFLVPQ
jgi:uncharacterized repeat protein (TIGR03943 family)